MNNEEYKIIILSALLHDIGKIYLGEELTNEFKEEKVAHGHARWSANFIRKFENKFSDAESLIDMVLYHGNPNKKKDWKNNERDENKIIKTLLISIADSLSSKERREEIWDEQEEEKEKRERSEIPLISIFNEINLGFHKEGTQKAYPLKILKIDNNHLFPNLTYPTDKLPSNAYNEIRKSLEEDFENLNKNDDIITIYHILYKHTWAVPSATPIVEVKPDVSLFDHARTTAAIASSLFQNYKLFINKYAEKLDNALRENFQIKKGKKNGPLSEGYQNILKEPLFLLLSADMFGIQDFIYAPSNIAGTSKRLRGRSFYLLVLSEVIARYIVYSLKLSFVNILYCAAGNFQILLPNTKEQKEEIHKILSEINKNIYEKFKGKLGFIFAIEEISSLDFETWDKVLKRVENKLITLKKQKMKDLLKEEEKVVFLPEDKIEGRRDVCKSCGETISYGEEICELCEKHKEIGERFT